MSDILIIFEDMLRQRLKGDIKVEYINGVLRAELTNKFLQYPLTVYVHVPEEHLYTPIAYEKITDTLYQKIRHYVEKNIFTWYD